MSKSQIYHVAVDKLKYDLLNLNTHIIIIIIDLFLNPAFVFISNFY